MAEVTMYNCDCMEFMRDKPDKFYDLGIVDPPYGTDVTNQSQGKGGGVARHNNYHKTDWDKTAPNKAYFNELIRVSKNQIIWGANHFISKIPFDSSCWIVWDKDNGLTDFADCELAWTSFDTAVRKIRSKWSGMLQENMKTKQDRIHPTEKPIRLYEWLLHNYAKPGDKILDTHGGSGSICIACHNLGFDLDWMELDKEYYDAAVKRFKAHESQLRLY